MKICGIICEFNPFHNGHKYLLERAREITRCDLLVCVMSGSFTQRGDIAVMDKYTRAKHAVLGGADCVLELPAAFAVSPAEIFSTGAVKILSSIPSVGALCFGSESGNREEILKAADILSEESPAFKIALAEMLGRGESYIKSYAAAFGAAGGNAELLQNPNDILAVEYAKAVEKLKFAGGAGIEIFPIKRKGSGYGDGGLKDDFSSASAIRKHLSEPLVKSNVPEFVYADLDDFSKQCELYERFLKLNLSRTSAEELKKVYGCAEGLENALKSLENLPFGEILSGATSKRYTSSRIKRILLASFLGIYAEDCAKFLSSPLYLTPLAVKREKADAVLSELAKSSFPVITGGGDLQRLGGAAKKCKALDDFAHSQWQQITSQTIKEKMLVI